MILSEEQLTAVKYYEGDVSGNDPFWSDPKAYVTLNSLFYPGIGTETRRAAEGKYLNPAVIEDTERLVKLCRDLLSAFHAADLTKERITYRVERFEDFRQMQEAGRTLSFTSTSSGGFLKAYGDRIGIALLEFHIPPQIPCLPFAEVMGNEYYKTEEQEVLLPPGLVTEFIPIEMSTEDKEIKDAEGKPPILKCRVLLHGTAPAESNAVFDAEDKTGPEAGMRIYSALNDHKEPDHTDIETYVCWKNALQAAILK